MAIIGQEWQKLDNFECDKCQKLDVLSVENDKMSTLAFLEAKKFE